MTNHEIGLLNSLKETGKKLLDIPTGIEEIPAGFFAYDASVTELIVPDSVRRIGDRAFYGCTALKKITIGRGAGYLGSRVFDSCCPGADMVWLSGESYRSLLAPKPLDFRRFIGIAAPHAPAWNSASQEERLVLACGYVLHPELETEYEEEIRQRQTEYILNELPAHLKELCDKGCIFEMLNACHGRGLIRDAQALERFITYARTVPVDKERKSRLDELATSVDQPESTQKKMIRMVDRMTGAVSLPGFMAAEGVGMLPEVSLAGTAPAQKAPAEVLQLILYTYMKQWPADSLSRIPDRLRFDPDADRLAASLVPSELTAAVRSIMGGMGLINAAVLSLMNRGKRLRVIVPLLRYGDETCCRCFITLAGELRDYGKYGKWGSETAQLIEKSLMLNGTPAAFVYCFRHDLLEVFAGIRGTDEAALVNGLLQSGFEDGPAGAEIGEALRDYLLRDASRLLTSGLGMDCGQWLERLGNRIARRIYSGLVWYQDPDEAAAGPGIRSDRDQNLGNDRSSVREKHSCDHAVCFVPAQEDGKALRGRNGETYAPDRRLPVHLAHPMEMKARELREWKRLFAEEGICQPVRQLDAGIAQLSAGDWSAWHERYQGLEVPAGKLQGLSEKGFVLQGRSAESLEVYYGDKHIMTCFPAEKSLSYSVPAEKDGSSAKERIMRLGTIFNVNFTRRRINGLVYEMDRAFCAEMAADGRLPAAPYVSLMTMEELRVVLRASAQSGRGDHSAAVLAELERRRGKEQTDDGLGEIGF